MHSLKKVLVTGATGAIGQAICEILAEHNFDVILGGRNLQKLQKLQNKLLEKHKGEFPIFLADMRSKKSILDAIEKLDNTTLYGLVNNAAETPRKKVLTEEGLECQFAVNILGYHRMICYLKDKIEQGGRIVNVASYWAGDLDLSDLQFNRRVYNNDTAYRQSKQADRMLTAAWAEVLRDKGITVNSCHPGDVNSKLSNDLGFGGHETPRQGADTPSYLIYSNRVRQYTGLYFAGRNFQRDRFTEDKKAVQKLFEICNQYC